MKKTIYVIGANSALAKAAMPVLAKTNTIIAASKKDCDITNKITLPSSVDVVINFAATFGIDSDEEISDAIMTNVLGTFNVCAAAKAAGIKHLINISTIFAELDNKSPHYSVYAITKKQGDELAKHYCRLNNISLAIIRPSRIYGDDNSFAKNQPFLYQIIDKAKKGEDIEIYGTNDASRNYIHAADLSEVLERVVEQHTEGVYACVYPTDATYTEIANAAYKIFGKGGHVSHLDDKPDIPDDDFPKDFGIYEKINYHPQISIETGLKRMQNHGEKK